MLVWNCCWSIVDSSPSFCFVFFFGIDEWADQDLLLPLIQTIRAHHRRYYYEVPFSKHLVLSAPNLIACL